MLILAALLWIAIVRVVLTWPVFNQTYDEGAKLAIGLHYLESGRFEPRVAHPPLGLAALALGPWMADVPAGTSPGFYIAGNQILYHGGRYLRNLALARAGVLPFLVLAAVVVWFWGRRLFGDGVALVGVALLTTTPEVLAHAGLATNDLSSAATIAAAMVAMMIWLERPSTVAGVLLGVTFGLALMTKFSALAVLPLVLVFFLAARLALRAQSSHPGSIGRHLVSAAVGAGVLFLVVWASYGFSHAPFLSAARTWGWFPGEGWGARLMRAIVGAGGDGIHVPAPEFVSGLHALFEVTDERYAFLLGNYSRDGWWYYFPVALLVKTPLPLVILVIIGAFHSLREALRERSWQIAAPLLGAAAAILPMMASSLNIGVRYVLPAYLPLSIVAALGVARTWRSGSRLLRWAVGLLLVVHVAATSAAHPDYLGYFNVAAGKHPERILTDSNIDWGQDLLRLRAELRKRNIQKVSLAYFGSAIPEAHGIPVVRRLPPDVVTDGWVAVSETAFNGVYTAPDAYAWLSDLEPVTTAGRSIRLYHVPPGYAAERSRRPVRDFSRAFLCW